MKLIKYGLPLLSTACVGFALATSVILTPQEQVTGAPNPPAVTTLGEGTIAGLGEVQAAGEPVAVGTPVPGLVRAVLVVAGHRVWTGDVLFAVDDRDLKAELVLREAALRVAESRLKKAKAGTRPEELPPLRATVEAAGPPWSRHWAPAPANPRTPPSPAWLQASACSPTPPATTC